MLGIVKKELNISIVASLFYVILGIIIIAFPEQALTVVSKIVAIFAIIYGIVVTIINIANIKEGRNLLLGVLLIVMGTALIIYPSSLNVLISLGIGIWFISISVSRIRFSTFLREVEEINWLVVLISSIITLIIGISFVFAPLASAVALTTISGILMIFYSLIDIFEVIFIKKNIEAIEKVIE